MSSIRIVNGEIVRGNGNASNDSGARRRANRVVNLNTVGENRDDNSTSSSSFAAMSAAASQAFSGDGNRLTGSSSSVGDSASASGGSSSGQRRIGVIQNENVNQGNEGPILGEIARVIGIRGRFIGIPEISLPGIITIPSKQVPYIFLVIAVAVSLLIGSWRGPVACVLFYLLWAHSSASDDAANGNSQQPVRFSSSASMQQQQNFGGYRLGSGSLSQNDNSNGTRDS